MKKINVLLSLNQSLRTATEQVKHWKNRVVFLTESQKEIELLLAEEIKKREAGPAQNNDTEGTGAPAKSDEIIATVG